MTKDTKKFGTTRRGFLKALGVGGVTAGAAMGFPHLWIPRAHANTVGFGTAKHLIYIRLSGGFRFPTAFNSDVGNEFSPWGTADGVAGQGLSGIGEAVHGVGRQQQEVEGDSVGSNRTTEPSNSD